MALETTALVQGAGAIAGHEPGSGGPLRQLADRFLFAPIRALFAAVEWLLGLAVLVLFLGVLAALPPLNLVALGILLDAQGRVARGGRLRDAFPLVPLAPRLGS